MGANCSSLANLNKNESLFQLCGSTPMTVNDPTWNQLFSFNLQIPLTKSENQALLEATTPLFQLLGTNNSSTKNAGSLLKVFLARAMELKASAQCDNRLFIWQTCNCLFILRVMLSHWVRTEREPELVAKFGMDSGAQPSESLLEKLAVQLVEILVDLPLRQETALLHREAMQTLQLLLFVAASSYLSSNKSILFRCLMQGPGALHAGLLTRTLLQHYCQPVPVPVRWLRKPEEGGSIVLGLATGLWGLISRSGGTGGSEDLDCPSDFAAQALLLLLVLTNHCTAGAGSWSNPYRQALLSFTDSQDPVQVSPVHPAACFRLDYSALYSVLCDRLGDERTTLLLYMLLHQHAQFRNYVYTHADIQRMVVALIKELFAAEDQQEPEEGSHHLYMSLIILLLLSEDEGFNSNVHNVIIRHPLWYTERSINEISLGGLVVLVVVRTIQRNVVKAADKYLHTNCLATLANMAAHFRRLHPYACQRLVSLLCVLNKRRGRAAQQLRTSDPSVDREKVEQELSVLEEVLRMLLEILNAALTHQMASNPHLVYTLLHQKEVLDVLRRLPAFQDVVTNLDRIANYFTARMGELLSDQPGVSEILQSIQLGCVDFPKDQLKKFPELKFRYVEEEQPEEFFIPYVWSLVQSTSSLSWAGSSSNNGPPVNNA